MLKQALAVHALTVRHNNLHFSRWRQVQVPMQPNAPASLRKALDALDAVEADLVREQRAAAQPRPRHYELTPQA